MEVPVESTETGRNPGKPWLFVLISPRPEELGTLRESLDGQPDITLKLETSAASLQTIIRTSPPELIILDEALPGKNLLELVREIVATNAMINTVAITSTDPETWHAQSEGLGMLPPLPNPPTGSDGRRLAANLRKLINQ